MRKVILTKAWSYGDDSFEVGELLEVDDGTAKQIVADGYGTLDDDSAHVKRVDVSPTTKTANDGAAKMVTIDLAVYEKMIADTVAAKVAAADKAGGDKGNDRVQIGRVHDRILDDPTRGYGEGNFGVYLQEVYADSLPGGRTTKRLLACNATKAQGSDEYATVEEAIGGYLIPPSFDPRLLEKGVEGSLARGRGTFDIPVVGQMVTINAITDANRTSTLYGGIQVYRTKERATMTASKGTFEQIEIKPKPLTALAYATDTQLHYAPTLAAIFGRQFQDAKTYKENIEFANGTGAGEAQGWLNADCKYSQTAETEPSSQAAATIVTSNLLKMRSHMRAEEYSNAMWFASLSCMEQLNTLTMDVGTGGSAIALVNIGNDGIERILGRELVYTEFAKAIGTEGDISLVSWPSYIIGDGTYTNVASSIHVRFDANETAFRFVWEMDAQWWWRSTLTLNNSWEVAPVVTLATRS